MHDRHTVSQDKRSAEVVQEYNLILKESLDAWDRYCLFDFEPVVKNSEHLLNNQIFFITESESRFYLKSDKDVVLERKNNELLDILRNKDLTYKFYPLEPSDIGDNCTGVKVAREFSSEDAFIVQKIPEQEKKDILFIRSVVPQLKYMRKVFVKGRDEASVENETFHNIIKVLQNTITFLFGLDSTLEHDYFEIEGMPNCSRQRLLKDLGVIDALISLIYLPFR